MVSLIANATDESNSFIDVASADDYYSARLYTQAWEELTEDDLKVRALIWASSVISKSYRWKGQRKSQAQILAFPRYGVSDSDGYTLDSTKVPILIKDATCELALRFIQANPASDSPLDSGLKELKVSSIILKFDKNSILDGSGVDGNGIPENIVSIFADYVDSSMAASGGVMKLVRA